MLDTNFKICEDGCLEWLGPFDNSGAPVRMSGRSIFSPVIEAFINANGLIEPGMVVIQKCGNKKCVNPLHLAPGTYAQYEAIVKGPKLMASAPVNIVVVPEDKIIDIPENPPTSPEINPETVIDLDVQNDDIKAAIDFLNNDESVATLDNAPIVEVEVTKPFQETESTIETTSNYTPGKGRKRPVYAEDEYFDCASDAGIVLGVGAQTIALRIKKGLPGYRYA